MKQYKSTGLIVILLIALLPVGVSQTADDDSIAGYTISGTVFDTDGSLAGSTSMKLSGYESIWTDGSGSYEFTNIPEGEYSLRAYFMDNGHTVAYRKIVLDANLELDWIVNHNWITIDSTDQQVEFSIDTGAELEVVQYSQLVSMGPYQIGEYYTVNAAFSDGQERDVVLKLRPGSSSEPFINHLSLNPDENCRFGILSDVYGNPIPNAVVTIGSQSVYSDNDGFYLFCGLVIGSLYNVTAASGAIELVNHSMVEIDSATGWFNITSEVIPEKPETPEFLLQSFDMLINDSPHFINWTGGDYTDHFDLFIDGELAYRGFNEHYEFTPTEPGTYVFSLLAVNPNGTTEATKSLTVVVLDDAGAGFWNVGMSWSYDVDYYPVSSDGTHNVTMTVAGTESMIDAFGSQQDCYLMKVVDEYDSPDRVRYHWIDTDNLLKVRTYSETSQYFVDGTMGWSYTTDSNEATNLFSGNAKFAHFNRTNIIGVPGHPNGYDDTTNTVTIIEGVMVETPSGNYSTTYYKITDQNDNVDSWELWYNETVRNWVKVIDRLPGSHSESVTYHLNDFSGMPSQPQFVTESSIINTQDYVVEWGPFASANSYDLLRDGEVVYTGDSTTFAVEDQNDGTYQYQIIARLFSGSEVVSEIISIEVDFKIPTPELNLPYAQDLEEDTDLYIEWTKTVEADWYSLQHTSPNGIVTEIYNGTDNFYTFDGLEEGQNRFRANLGYTNGKYSDLSNSSYVNLIASPTDESNDVNFVPTIGVLAVIGLAVIILNRRGDDDE